MHIHYILCMIDTFYNHIIYMQETASHFLIGYCDNSFDKEVKNLPTYKS